jgi:hypothetical protein
MILSPIDHCGHCTVAVAKRRRKPKRQSRIDNPVTLETSGTQDT